MKRYNFFGSSINTMPNINNKLYEKYIKFIVVTTMCRNWNKIVRFRKLEFKHILLLSSADGGKKTNKQKAPNTD